MAVLIQSIVDRVSKTLYDETQVVWAAAEVLSQINTGIATVAQLDETAAVTNASFACVVGTKQSLPLASIAAVEVRRNMGADGNTPGGAITPISFEHLSRADPNWPTTSPSNSAQHYMLDERDPRTFYLYPGVASVPSYVELVQRVTPAPVLVSGNLPLPDVYANAVYYFAVAHALARRGMEKDQATAAAFTQLFYQVLGIDAKAISASAAGKIRAQAVAQQ